MVFWLLNSPKEEALALSEGVLKLKEELHFCRLCNNLSDGEICMICSDSNRDDRTVCVVENPKDLLAIERSGAYRGHYHVLLGAISPTDGRGPDDLKIESLARKVRDHAVKEVVIATDPDIEGEMTALHIIKELKPTGVKVSRIGLGIPVGGAVEYADLSTLSMSLKARREIPVHEVQ
jgi:recombination protein RecR